ncbi:Asp-tRNA(Asn)/Glu-tRNA(Gln) amidotransferase subunit GatC [Candidatus Uhrbacteria bacterium]|nr:Asp-tRNA(Asn)/Glu-tRNA(Gln) amidotransferase subunit GatC [Candidatus Uhrbacteria bacterium]
MPLSNDDVKYIAKLARLHINDDEVEQFSEQLSSILDYVAKLQEVNTDNVPELQHALDVSNVFRDDVEDNCVERTRNIALENFSNRNGDLLEVQSVFDRNENL